MAVRLTRGARRDIEDIYRYVAENDSLDKADTLIEMLLDLCRSLANFPERGNRPKELMALGMTEFRELHHGPYRAIYSAVGDTIYVHAVVDGRRDMQTLLRVRLSRRMG